ncbi:MAG: WHG domain-containing protein [Proteobacteria bacterium]|nr:WHG domain-containing protein [Pseudomonadota bacterium]
MARRKGPALTQRHVLAAALRVVKREGAGGLGVHPVARELGIQAPSVYHHVKGSEGLRRAAAIEGWRRLGDQLDRDGDARRRPRAELVALCHRYRAFVRREPELYDLMTHTLCERRDADFRRVTERLQALFETRLRPLGLRGADAVHAVRVLRAGLHGFACLELGKGFGPASELDASFDRLAESLVAGLDAAAPPPEPGG